MNSNMDLLIRSLGKWNIKLSITQVSQFNKYYELLIEWNKRMNLTAITDLEEVVQKHFLDSCALFNYINLENHTLMDVGTGAGFPGIPLKILAPDCNIVLVDSLNKRLNFLNEVIKELSLKNITTVHSRIEPLAHDKEYREKFDIVTSRAVAYLSVLSEYCLPFVKIGGVFAPYKSGNISDEISDAKKAISVLGGKINSVEEFDLPFSDYSRSIIMIDKVKSSPNKYPRRAGTPTKSPIK